MFEDNNQLYSNLDNEILLTKISHLDIPFDKKWKRIAVNLSGGADSALLTFFLCKIIKENSLNTIVDVITYQRNWTTRPWQGYISLQVYTYLKNMYPNIIQDRYTTYIPPELEHGVAGPIVNGRSGDQIIVGSFNKFAAWNYNFDAVFNATSKNPDDSRPDRMKNRDIDAKDGNALDVWFSDKRKKTVFAHPFKFVKKDWIVAQYHLHGILDLYYTTRSCEGDINHHDVIKQACSSFKEYIEDMYIPKCNQCWWCDERSWADSRVTDMIAEIKNG